MVQGSVEGAANSASEHERAVQEWFVAERNARHGRDEVRALYDQHAAGELDDGELQRRIDECVRWITDMYAWLRATGWFPGRDIGAEAAGCRQLAEAGWTVTPAAEAFLRQYALLDFSVHPRTARLHIDGRSAAYAEPADVDSITSAYAEQIGRPLVPIGEMSMMMVMIDNSGELWGGFDADYGALGGSMREFFKGSIPISPRRLNRALPGWREGMLRAVSAVGSAPRPSLVGRSGSDRRAGADRLRP